MAEVKPDDEHSLHYVGWRIVAALFLVELAMFGFGLYGQGIYLTELRRLNGWPTALISTGRHSVSCWDRCFPCSSAICCAGSARSD